MSRLLVKLYPRAWRQRYGAELEALLEDDPPGPRGWLDLLKGALEQHMTRWRAGRMMAAGAVAGALVAVGLYLVLPKTYVSRAVVGVTPVTAAAKSGEVIDHINWISEMVLSRSSLWSVINTFGLYPGERQRMPLEQLIERMRRDIHIAPSSVLGGEARPAGFTIEFAYPDRQVAQRVTQDLLARFIDQNYRIARGSVQFEMLDPATLSLDPVAPLPLHLAAYGLAARLGLGALGAFFRRGERPKLVTEGVLEVTGGALVFGGTSVPVGEMLDYLKSDRTLSQFLDDFPSVNRDAAIAALGAITSRH